MTWEQDYKAGLERAKKDKKLVMVDMYTDWCGWCKKLDKDTFSDKDVADKLAKDFVAVKLNPEKSPKGAKLAKQFGTTGLSAYRVRRCQRQQSVGDCRVSAARRSS